MAMEVIALCLFRGELSVLDGKGALLWPEAAGHLQFQ